MFCPNCGNNMEGFRVCKNCGIVVEEQTPQEIQESQEKCHIENGLEIKKNKKKIIILAIIVVSITVVLCLTIVIGTVLKKSGIRQEIFNANEIVLQNSQKEELDNTEDNAEQNLPEASEDSENEDDINLEEENAQENQVEEAVSKIDFTVLNQEAKTAYTSYMENMSEENCRFAILDVNQDGIVELICQEDFTESARSITGIGVYAYREGQVMTLWEGNTSEMSLLWCNDNCLVVSQGRDADCDKRYYVIFHGSDVLVHSIYVEHRIDPTKQYYEYYVNGELQSKELSPKEEAWLGLWGSDPYDVFEQFGEDRLVQTAVPLVLSPNTAANRKYFLQEESLISEWEWGLMEFLCGIIHFENLYSTYSEEEVSVTDWSDERKLEILNFLLFEKYISDRIGYSTLDDSCELLHRAGIMENEQCYYAIKDSEVNRVLEGIFGKGLEGTSSTDSIKYQDGFYFFLVTGDWGEFQPCGVIDRSSIIQNEDGSFQFRVECGEGEWQDTGRGITVSMVNVEDEYRRAYTIRVRKDNRGFLSRLIIEEWQVAE